MSVNRNTSRVFETARQFKARLVDASWPADPRDSVVPAVTFDVDARPGENSQTIRIATSIGDDSLISWRSMPGLRSERFDVIAIISIKYIDTDPNEDLEAAMLDRLEALADVIQREFFDDESAVVSGMFKPLAIPEAQDDSAVGQVSFMMASTSDGLFGEAIVTYGPKFRI